jgi:hypothetical protein
VIMFEPFFDQYLPSVTFNGGTPVYVPLHPQTDAVTPNNSNWKIDFDELRYVGRFAGSNIPFTTLQPCYHSKSKNDHHQYPS